MAEQEDPRPLYTINEVCKALQVSRSTLYRVLKSGQLFSVHVGKQVRIPAEALDAYRYGLPWEPPTSDDLSTWPPTPALFPDVEDQP